MGKLTSASDTIEERTPAKAWLILVVIYLASLMAPLAQFKIPALASWLMPAFGLDGTSFGLLMSCLSIIGFILAFPAAFIARRIGLKLTVALSLGFLALGTLVCLLGSNVAVLYAGRLIEGLGLGLIGVTAPSCVSVWFPEKTRGRALGIWATWFPVGNVLTFYFAPLAAERFGWTIVFWTCFFITVAVLVVFLIVFYVPEGVEESNLGDVKLSDSWKYLKNKNIWMLGIVFFCFNFLQLGAFNSFYNTFLETMQGLSATDAASMVAWNNVGCTIFIIVAGLISDRTAFNKKRYWVALGFAFYFVALVVGWQNGEGTMIFSWALILLFALGSGCTAGFSRPMCPIIMGGGVAGVTMGMGVLQLMQNAGAAISPTLFGWGYETLGWQMASNCILLPVCILGIVGSLFIIMKKPRSEKAPIRDKDDE